MPALPVIANAAIVFQRLFATDARAMMGNRFALLATSALSANQFAEGLALAYNNNLLTNMSSTISMRETEVQLLDGATPLAVITTPQYGHTGGFSGTPLPLNVNKLVTWRSLERGRSHRGRTYFPGLITADLTASDGYKLTSTTISDLSTGANDFIAALAGGANPLTLCILSLKLGAMVPVDHASVNPNIVTQRRRVEKVARH